MNINITERLRGLRGTRLDQASTTPPMDPEITMEQVMDSIPSIAKPRKRKDFSVEADGPECIKSYVHFTQGFRQITMDGKVKTVMCLLALCNVLKAEGAYWYLYMALPDAKVIRGGVPTVKVPEGTNVGLFIIDHDDENPLFGIKDHKKSLEPYVKSLNAALQTYAKSGVEKGFEYDLLTYDEERKAWVTGDPMTAVTLNGFWCFQFSYRQGAEEDK